MAYIRQNRGLTIPPGPVMVNPHHPLASRMRSLILFDNVQPIDQIGQLGRFTKVGTGSISVGTSQYGRYLDCVGAGVRSAWPLGLTYWSDADWPHRRYTTVIVAIQTVAANNSSEDAKAPVLIDTTGYYEGGFGLFMGNTYGTGTGWYPMEPSGAGPGTIQQTWFVDGKAMVTGTAGHIAPNKVYGLAVKSVGYFNNGYVNFGVRRYSGNYSLQGGGPLLCYVLEGDLPDDVLEALTLNPTEPLLFAEDLVFATPIPSDAALGPITGTGEFALSRILTFSIGSSMIGGGAAAELRAVTGSGVGASAIAGGGAAGLSPVQESGAGSSVIAGAGALDWRANAAQGSGVVSIPGGGGAALSPVQESGIGSPVGAGTGSVALRTVAAQGSGSPFVAASGAIGGPIEGGGIANLGPIGTAGSGAPVIAGAGTLGVSPMALASGVVVELRGTALVVIERLGATASARSSIEGVGAVALGRILAAGSNLAVEPDEVWEIAFDAETNMEVIFAAEAGMAVAFPAEAAMSLTFPGELGFEFVDQG